MLGVGEETAASSIAVQTRPVLLKIMQKAATLGMPIAAVVKAAPTTLVVRAEERTGTTAVARGGAFEILTPPDRVATEAETYVA